MERRVDGLDDSDWSVILDTLFLVQIDDSEATWTARTSEVLELDPAATVAASAFRQMTRAQRPCAWPNGWACPSWNAEAPSAISPGSVRTG